MSNGLRRFINILVIGLCISMIWGFSLKPGAASHNQSGEVEAIVMKICAHYNINIDKKYYKVYAPFVEDPNNISTEEAIRKTAHFTEYFVFGFLCALLTIMNRRKFYAFLYLFMGAAVAYVDERVIQLHLVAGRTSSFRDVLLDCIGFYIAYCLITTIMIPFACRRTRRRD